jgi:hypothetical protein
MAGVCWLGNWNFEMLHLDITYMWAINFMLKYSLPLPWKDYRLGGLQSYPEHGHKDRIPDVPAGNQVSLRY